MIEKMNGWIWLQPHERPQIIAFLPSLSWFPVFLWSRFHLSEIKSHSCTSDSSIEGSDLSGIPYFTCGDVFFQDFKDIVSLWSLWFLIRVSGPHCLDKGVIDEAWDKWKCCWHKWQKPRSANSGSRKQKGDTQLFMDRWIEKQNVVRWNVTQP